ncbi:MAG: hypothetical protein JWP89_2363 [Schlesneria sp.]|nr:hypothetical protein [Schlesneria sp.]
MEAAYQYTCGNINEAASGFEALSRSGHPAATSYLAMIYLHDLHDTERGIELYELAVSQGDSDAAYNLGALYRTGAWGIPKDPAKSRAYLIQSQAMGCKLSVADFLKE